MSKRNLNVGSLGWIEINNWFEKSGVDGREEIAEIIFEAHALILPYGVDII